MKIMLSSLKRRTR